MKHNRCELIATHCKKGPLGMSLASLIIIISIKYIIPLHTIFIKNHNLLILIFLAKKKFSNQRIFLSQVGFCQIQSVVTCKKSLLSMFFAVFININISKCMKIALNTLFFHIHQAKTKKLCGSGNPTLPTILVPTLTFFRPVKKNILKNRRKSR